MTDHKHAAEDWLETAKGMSSEEGVRAQAALALVHATLAQTEQLRLANVIAWTTQAGRMPSPETRDVVAKGMGI